MKKPSFNHGIAKPKIPKINYNKKPQKSGLQTGYQTATTTAPSTGRTGADAGASSTSPLPWDATEQTQEGLLNKNYANQMAQLGYQEQTGRADYGFDSEFASNPLTRANLLQKSYDQSRLGATNSMAARGQLYSGATSNALGYADFNHNVQYDQLQKSYADMLNKIAQGRVSATQSRDEGLASAQADALSRALAQDPEAITPEDGGDQGSAPGARSKVKKAATKAKVKKAITSKGVPQKSNLKKKK